MWYTGIKWKRSETTKQRVIKSEPESKPTCRSALVHLNMFWSKKGSSFRYRWIPCCPDYINIIEDLFDSKCSVDLLGPRTFLIVFMLVNAKTMNLETALQSFFATFENQSFTGGQNPELMWIEVLLKTILEMVTHKWKKIWSN